MYCPICKTEYREGFTKCADCMVPLVETLPPEKPEPIPEYVDLQEIMTSISLGDIEIGRSILNDNQIPCVVEGETAIGMPARILVPKDKAKKAKEALKDFL